MRYFKLLIFILLIPMLCSCSGNASKKDIAQVSPVANSQDAVPTSGSPGAENRDKSTPEKGGELVDLEQWKHPTRDVLENYKIKIIKVELLKDKTYPIFYVELTQEVKKENGDYFKGLATEISKANGYWDYELNNVKHATVIDVVCNRKTQQVVSISVNGDKGYFDKLDGNPGERKPVEVSPISRGEAGLSTVELLNFSNFKLNQRLGELLADSRRYKDEDYKNGIDQEAGLLINERLKDNIIQNIKIGTGMEDVKRALGKPSVSDADFIFYKTKEYYLGFKGSGKVEYVWLKKRLTEYNRDILRLIIERLGANDNLAELANSNDKMSAFFDSSGHIHGGGWYANSSYGVSIEQFDGSSMVIYNNFEGNLYKAKNFAYEISYADSDYEINTAMSIINGYIGTNDEFNRSGVLSPSGKRKCTFMWGNSDVHYFTIRTMDNSRPDFMVSAPAGEFRWLTDDYILYMNAWFSSPYVVKVNPDNTEREDINVMYAVGVFEKDDMFQDSQINLTLKDVKNNVITFYDEEHKKEYKVGYSMNNNNKIQFKLKN